MTNILTCIWDPREPIWIPSLVHCHAGKASLTHGQFIGDASIPLLLNLQFFNAWYWIYFCISSSLLISVSFLAEHSYAGDVQVFVHGPLVHQLVLSKCIESLFLNSLPDILKSPLSSSLCMPISLHSLEIQLIWLGTYSQVL